MARITVSKSGEVYAVIVPDEFAAVIAWLCKEQKYVHDKWNATREEEIADGERAADGLDEGAWFWNHGVFNYVDRIRLFGIKTPLGMQAMLKLISTLVSIPQALIREQRVPSLPKAGLSSGNLQ